MIINAVVIGLIGLCFGSFINAVVWRIHKGRNFVNERSECEYCHHVLEPAELVPVFSWLFLGGKCSYCKKPVSWQHPVIELSLGIIFAVSYLAWPNDLVLWNEWFGLIAWLAYMTGLLGLFIYDLKWMILPNKIVFALILVAIADVAVRFATTGVTLIDAAQHIIFGIMSVGGVYAFLYFVSKGKWVGFGDVKLGLFIGLVLGWEKGLLVLGLSNVIGLLFVAPALLTKRLTTRSKVPFGPFLIIAFVISGLFGQQLIDWYISLIVPAGF